jgi:hypothetical protein
MILGQSAQTSLYIHSAGVRCVCVSIKIVFVYIRPLYSKVYELSNVKVM